MRLGDDENTNIGEEKNDNFGQNLAFFAKDFDNLEENFQKSSQISDIDRFENLSD
jgi:hypothetical protein